MQSVEGSGFIAVHIKTPKKVKVAIQKLWDESRLEAQEKKDLL